MEIEIITTKKKLSKSLINQMRFASVRELQLGTGLGYLINIKKNIHKLVLIKYEGEFFIIPANYTQGATVVYRKVGRLSSKIEFDSIVQCNSWWSFYQARMIEAVNQIYI
jgi:hypothetical protein